MQCAMLEKFVATLREELRKVELYPPQKFLQLVLNRFWPLQGTLHWAMIRATYLAMVL